MPATPGAARTRSARTERRHRRAGIETTATRVAVALVIAGPVLAVVAAMLGAAEVYPYEHALAVSLAVMGGCIGAALLIGAVGGLYVMGGPRVAPLGVIFVAGVVALVVGLARPDATVRDLGVVLLAASGAVFSAVGVVAGWVPAAALARWGNVAAVAGGLVLAVVGRATGGSLVMLFGAMAAGCGLGAIAGRRWLERTGTTDDSSGSTPVI